MKQLARHVIVFFCLYSLLGCATTIGRNFSSDGVKRLSIGNTTEEDIIELFGEPFRRQVRFEGNVEYHVFIYSYGEGRRNSGKSRYLDVEFANGVLNGYIFNSSLAGDSTDFNIETASKLKDGSMQLNEILALIGPPSGELRFPSILLKRNFGSMPEAVPPTNASTALVYSYIESKVESGVVNAYVKLIIIFSRSDGSIIESRFFKGTV